MFYELSRLAVGNLLRARTRLVMTAGGVLVGTTAVILLIAFTIGLQTAAEAGLGNSTALTEIQVYPNYGFGPNSPPPDEIPQLDVEAVRKLWRIPGVAAVIPIVNLQGGEMLAGDYSGYTQIMGIDPALLPYLGVRPQQGQLSMQPGEVIVGAHTGDYFFDPTATDYQPVYVDLATTPLKLRLYQYSGQTPQDRKINVKVTAVLQEGTSFDTSMFMPIQDVIKHNEWITGQEFDSKTFKFDQITVRATSRETTNNVSETIRDMGYGAGGMGDFLNQLNSFFGTMRLVLGGVGGVALLVAAFGVANTMTMAILERTKEIGLMKAIGATDRDILTVFVIEAGLVGFVGGAAGVALSLFLQNVINQAILNAPQNQDGIMFLPFDPAQIGGNLVIIPTELSLFAIILATLVGVSAGLYPALRAAHLPPVVALKME
jgi:putative ABC transport system permease protein